MAIVKMQQINIYALSIYSKAILETLQRMGVVQIENRDFEDSVFYKTQNKNTVNSIKRSAQTMAKAAKILEEYSKEPKRILKFLEGKKILTLSKYEETARKSSEALSLANKLITLKNNISDYKTEIAENKNRINALSPWQSLNVSLSSASTRTTKTITGSIREMLTEAQIKDKIAGLSPELNLYEIKIISSASNNTCIFAVCHKSEYEDFF